MTVLEMVRFAKSHGDRASIEAALVGAERRLKEIQPFLREVEQKEEIDSKLLSLYGDFLATESELIDFQKSCN